MNVLEIPTNSIASSTALVDKREHITRQTTGLGKLPVLSVFAALGVAFISLAHTASRQEISWAIIPYWIGFSFIFVPCIARLLSADPSRKERIAVIILLAVALYLTKVTHSPTTFTFADELSQLHDGERIVLTSHLFSKNPYVPVTHLYPGLASVGNAMRTLSGLPLFNVALVIMGVTRIVLALALFFIYEKSSGSARVASIGAAIYMTNPNYVYFSAEYSYESLAIPLMLSMLAAMVWQINRRQSERSGMSLLALLFMSTVVISHHMTSFASIGFLLAIGVYALINPVARREGFVHQYFLPSGATMFVLVGAWIIYISLFTINYLSPVLGGAVESIIRVILREESGRTLFNSDAGSVIPLWERIAALGTVAIIALSLLFSLKLLWDRRNQPLVVIIGLLGVLYIPMLGLRFTSAGWETSSRSTQFLYIGIGLAMSMVIVYLLNRQSESNLLRKIFVGSLSFMFVGGIVSAWQPDIRLARPTLYRNGNITIEPQSVSTAKWTRKNLGTSRRIATFDFSNAILVMSYGLQIQSAGTDGGLEYALFSNEWREDDKSILRNMEIEFVLLDRRYSSFDHMKSSYFVTAPTMIKEGHGSLEVMDRQLAGKFDGRKDVNKIYDSGDIAIYDVRSALYDNIPIATR
jgi:hypothetical protein